MPKRIKIRLLDFSLFVFLHIISASFPGTTKDTGIGNTLPESLLLGQLSLASLRGRLIECQLRLG